MWIKEIVLEGFKSYAHKTTISGWDPSFNAITGLNGSGKSNILDAICFVLGISSLSQVRVHHLQELVYKQGQAGVTKASVTIVFDNSDSKMSPVGYEQYKEITVSRQVVIGGRNKYLINGSTAQLSRVQNLFHSVQLNINNPHFLIFQGRITKVINMKPLEILSLIEEAAGTRMYETKKKGAQKTMAKKQGKVNEINKILTEEIEPQLERLRQERANFVKWSNNNTEMYRLQRFCIAYKFFDANQLLAQGDTQVQALEESVEKLEGEVKELKEHLKEQQRRIKELTKEKEEELSAQLSELEQKTSAHHKEFEKYSSIYQNKKETLAVEQKQLNKLTQNLDTVDQSIDEKTKEKKEYEKESKEVEKKHNELSNHLLSLQNALIGIDVNVDSKNGGKEKGSLTSQLMCSQQSISEAQSEIKQLQARSTHLREEVQKLTKQTQAAEKEHKRMQAALEKKQNQLQQLKQQEEKMASGEEGRSDCERKINEIEERLSNMREEADKIRPFLTSLKFEYQDPSPGFDRSKVKGLIAHLIRLKDEKTALALEAGTAGRLFNVVIDSQETGKHLLERGRLRNRITFIPLDKVDYKITLTPSVIATAQNLVGKDKVRPALSLIEYDDEVKKAIEFVFGNFLVCDDFKTAEVVAFHPKIRAKTVTLLGECFDPAGTLKGGAQSNERTILSCVHRLRCLQNKIDEDEKRLESLSNSLKELNEGEAEGRELKQNLELLIHEVKLMETRLEQSSYAQLDRQLQQYHEQLTEIEQQIEKIEATKAEEEKKSSELESDIGDFESHRGNKTKQVEKEVEKEKAQLSSSSKALEKSKRRLEKINLELDSLQEEKSNTQNQIQEKEALIKQLSEEVDEAQIDMDKMKSNFEKAKSNLEAEREKLQEADSRIGKLMKEKKKLTQEQTDKEMEAKKTKQKIQRIQNDLKDAKKRTKDMINKYDWIESEKHLFGRPHTDYDFQKLEPKEAEKALKELQNEQEHLAKKINKKVNSMYEAAEQQYKDLTHKRSIIETDKQKIEEVIAELDRKKNEALETTCKKVTKDFSSIFSILLPGAQACMQPVDGNVLDGLEIRVAFGNVWKTSLSELSGGQRSLLALSLILSLLLFKPAPMYILDEVDAALDLSHTQNIGTMLRTHFPQSQFIVVSLKEGMFNNANVIFRTKFADGISTVSYTRQKKKIREDDD